MKKTVKSKHFEKISEVIQAILLAGLVCWILIYPYIKMRRFNKVNDNNKNYIEVLNKEFWLYNDLERIRRIKEWNKRGD